MSCHCHEGHCDCEEEKESVKERVFLFVRVVASLVLALLGQFLLNEERVGLGWNLFVMVLAYLIIAFDILYKAVKHIVIEHEWFDECFLMAIASLGAFALRAYGPEHNEFLEAVLVIWLYQIGEFLSDVAADKSREAIVSAIDLREETALVVINGKIEERKAEDIHKGDIVFLQSGRKVHCDGLVISGTGQANESSLTGEAMPVYKESGSKVYSGTLLVEGELRVEASCDYADSTVAKLMELIEEGAEEKSKATRFITKFAKIYTPIVILLALLLAIVPPLFLGIGEGEIWARWIYVGLSLLVISCPCAIVISVPLAYFAGLGLASKNGILIKGASYLDKALEIKAIAFDKTGTLTKGEIRVENIMLVSSEHERYVALAESVSSHPIAKAICSLYPQAKLGEKDHVKEVAGKGIEASIDGCDVLVGNKTFLGENGIVINDEEDSICVYVAVDGKYSGKITLKDEIKSTSAETISKLRGFGIHTYLLSGDRKTVCDEANKTLGCDGVFSELLPEEKQNAVRSLASQNSGMVAYCGDGINDAPTLALADVGIAMGRGGSDVALDNANVVLVEDEPSKVVSFLECAKKTRQTATFNIVFSLLVKLVIAFLSLVSALTAAFTLPLWVAVLADSGLASLMVFNSLLLHFRHLE